MSGKLKNRTRRALTFNLTTKVAPIRHVFPRREEHKDGRVVVADRRLVLPDSVTVLAGKLSDRLPDGAPHCPEIAAAIDRREVEWIEDTAEELAAEQAAAEKADAESLAEMESAPKATAAPRSSGPKSRKATKRASAE